MTPRFRLSLLSLSTALLLASCDSSTSADPSGSDARQSSVDTLKANTPTAVPSGSGNATTFLLPVNSGDQFQITLQGGSANGLVVLREPEGDTVKVTTTTSGKDQRLVNFQTNWSGHATVVVPASSTSLELLVQLRVGGVLLDRWEPDSTLATGPVAGATPLSRTLHPNDEDYFQLPGSVDSQFTVRIEGRTRGRASLLDSTGKVVRSISIPESAGVVSSLSYHTTTSKPWGLLVESSSRTDTGAYTVKASGRRVLPVDRWECASCASTKDTPDTLVVGKAGNIRTLTAGDFDRSVIRCDSGKRYLVKAICQRPLSFAFREPDGFGASGSSDVDLADGAIVITTTLSGWMTIESHLTSDTDSATYSYLVSLAPEVVPDTFESNNTKAQAKSVTADSTPYTATLSRGDEDWYQFQADSGTYYKMDLLGQVQVFVTPFQPVTDDYIGSVGVLLGENIVLEAKKTGTMRFLVTANEEFGTYGFRLSKLKVTTPDTAEPDNDTAHARDLPLDSVVLHRNMEPSGDDWFRFQATSGATYTLTFSYASGNLDADVYDSKKNSLANSRTCNSTSCVQSWKSEYTGPAYLLMSGDMASFSPYDLAMQETKSP